MVGRRLYLLICVVSVLGLVNSTCAGLVIMRCDVGDCGPLQSGWSGPGGCGTHINVDGSGIDVILATGNPGACECRNEGGTGTLADVETDLLFADNETTSPGSDFIITFSNLGAGVTYRLLSYHNRSNEGDTTIPNITITGATVVSKPDSITQNHDIMTNPAECVFIPAGGDVSVRFRGPGGGCAGCQAFLNGFVLEYGAPTVGFAQELSGNPEAVTPGVIQVILSEPQAEVVTVDYEAVGGTAENGVDYVLAPDTLTFDPGVTSQVIPITIINDGLPENDETIEVTLSDVTGADVLLGGITQHTYVIVDPRPEVGFETPFSSDSENISPAVIPVVLSEPIGQLVTVDYTVTGGTAEAGADFVLAAGTLYFEALETVETIDITILEDDIEEVPDETIELTLSNASPNAKLGLDIQHTYTIIDNESVIVLEEFVGDSFSSFNHASSIAQTHNGTLVVTWYGGSREGADDVAIWVSRNTGSGWSPRLKVEQGSDSTWNPVIFQPKTGPLLLWYKYGGSPDAGWEGSLRQSHDNGGTWSARIPLPTSSDPYLSGYRGRFVGPTKNRPIEFPDGRLLLGSSTEDNDWRVHMEIVGPANNYTTDYQLIGPIGGGIQPTFLVHDDDYQTIQAICRSGDMKWSYDGGNTWPDSTPMPFETTAGLHAVTINNLNSERNRWHILAYNQNGREPLKIAISQDGINWTEAISNLDSGGDMDYPTIMQSSDKMLHVTYSYSNHSKIKHVVINPYVLLGEAPDPPCPGDFYYDLMIDARDLEVFAYDWLKHDYYTAVGTEPDANGLALHYKFDETSGSTAYDSSQGGYDGQVKIVSSDALYTGAWDASGFDANGCANFNGNTKVVVPAAPFAAMSSAVSVSLWINGDTAVQPDSGWGMVFQAGKPGNDRVLLAHIPTPNNSGVMFESGGYNVQRLFWTGDSPADWEGQWNHYVFTLDTASGLARIFCNGDKKAERTGATTGVGGISSFMVGNGFVSSTNYEYFGKIDDYRVYSYALSPEEVQYVANGGPTMTLVPLDSKANLYDDDVVDLKDFALFASQWLETCP